MSPKLAKQHKQSQAEQSTAEQSRAEGIGTDQSDLDGISSSSQVHAMPG